MPQRMPSKEQVLKLIIYQFGRRVIITLYLVADDIYLMVYLMLWILAMENDIRQQVDGTHKMLTLNSCIEDRIFFIGKSIQIAP